MPIKKVVLNPVIYWCIGTRSSMKYLIQGQSNSKPQNSGRNKDRNNPYLELVSQTAVIYGLDLACGTHLVACQELQLRDTFVAIYCISEQCSQYHRQAYWITQLIAQYYGSSHTEHNALPNVCQSVLFTLFKSPQFYRLVLQHSHRMR